MRETSALIGATMGGLTMLAEFLADERVKRDFCRELKEDPARRAQVMLVITQLQEGVRESE